MVVAKGVSLCREPGQKRQLRMAVSLPPFTRSGSRTWDRFTGSKKCRQEQTKKRKLPRLGRNDVEEEPPVLGDFPQFLLISGDELIDVVEVVRRFRVLVELLLHLRAGREHIT